MIIVSDASPLIAMASLDLLSLFESMSIEILLPNAVFQEISKYQKPFSKKLRVWAKDKIVIVENKAAVQGFTLMLDQGEAEAFALFYEKKAGALLIDEKKGRRVAVSQNIPIIGSIGILVLAKQQGLLKSIAPFLNLLKTSEIRVSDALIQKALELTDEL